MVEARSFIEIASGGWGRIRSFDERIAFTRIGNCGTGGLDCQPLEQFFIDEKTNAIVFSEAPGEPGANIPLETNSGFSCPGYYTATVELQTNAAEGAFGMEILATAGSRLLSGGLNLGGVMRENGGAAGFGAFNIANPSSEPQVVNVKVDAQVLPTDGFLNSNFKYVLEVIDSDRNTVGDPVYGTSTTDFSVTVNPGFYIVRIRTTEGAPRGTFQMGLNTRFVDRAGGGFQGGANVGGYLARAGNGKSLAGFAGFCIADSQVIKVRTEGRSTRGVNGAGPVVLQVKDRNRDVLLSFDG